MANYEEYCRTNYFRVKDHNAFEDWICEISDVRIECRPPSGKFDETQFCLIFDESLPEFTYNDDGEEREIDWVSGFAKHLADGDTVVIIQIGHEKMRYLSGNAWAIHSDGREAQVNLVDIYELCQKEFGTRPTEAEY